MDDLSRPPGLHTTVESLIAEAVSAPLALAPGTVVADRYVIARELGAGGMGTVYLARDRSLERDVALKLHRRPGEIERVRREAIAMAKLAHPNVVTVFEVGEHDRRTFVAMEYVAGTTLRAWSAERSSREILGALLAAGTGLAAIHAAGLVHRDVKPDNIFVGTDGRARIGDFGLAVVSGDGATEIAGTPAYMAPEQLDGQADARCDQFAFCVAAWELLSGERPFGGDTVEALRAAIATGELRSGRRALPRRVRRALARGLAADPAARYPSMTAVVDALRVHRRREIAITAVLGAAGAITWALWPAADPAAACARAGRDIDALVPPAAVAAVASALRDARSGVEQNVIHAGEALRAQYRAIASQACVAEVRGQWSPELAAASRECLIYRAATAHELIATPTLTTPADMAQIVTQLPVLSPCGDARMLAGWRSPAADPIDFAEIATARARLDAAVVLVQQGRLVAARRLQDEAAASAQAAVPDVAGRLELVRALVEIATGDYGTGERRLADAYFASRARDDDELALTAAHELINDAVMLGHDREVVQRWASDGLAEADRAAPRLPAAAASVYAVAAGAAYDSGDADVALQRVARAELLDGGASVSLRAMLLGLRADIYADRGKVDDAIAASTARVDLLREALGPRHPALADALASHALLLGDVGRPQDAMAAATQALALIDERETPSATLARIEINVGGALLQMNDDDHAFELLTHARRGWVAAYGEEHPEVARIDANLAIIDRDRGELDRALDALRHAAAVEEHVFGSESIDLAGTLFNLGSYERDAKRYAEALATAKRCEAIFAKREPGSMRRFTSLDLIAAIENLAGDHQAALAAASQVIETANASFVQAHAWARLEAAHARIALHHDTASIKALLADARKLYATAELPARVAEVDKLLAGLR